MFNSGYYTGIFIICLITGAALVELRYKCHIADIICVTRNHGELLRTLTVNGMPNASIPIIDPLKLTNIKTKFDNDIQVTLVEGEVTGMKDCTYHGIQTSTQGPIIFTTFNITCNLELTGEFKVFIPQSFMKEIEGDVNTTAAEGFEETCRGKLRLERIKFDFYVPYTVEAKNTDYFFNFSVIQLLHVGILQTRFTLENFKPGSKLNNTKILDHLSNRAIQMTPITVILKRVLDFYQLYVQNYLSNVATKHYIMDDLSGFVRCP